MNKTSYLQILKKAFKDLHECEAKHLETVPVKETFQGKTVWEGEVEVFQLIGHPKTKKGYAWSYSKNSDQDQVVAVLELPPVISPQTAVKAYIVAETKAK